MSSQSSNNQPKAHFSRASGGYDRGMRGASPVNARPLGRELPRAERPRQTGGSDPVPRKVVSGLIGEVRLNKLLAERLGLSRREADDAIAAGRVKLGNRVAKLGDRVNTSGSAEEVRFDGKLIPFETNYLYLAMHKPVGYVCSRRAQGNAPTIYELLPKKYQHLKTVGRLDKDSSGLILLTNDGDFAYQHTHPKFGKQKLYEVTLDRPLEPLHQQMISDYGVMLDDGPSRFTVTRDTEVENLSSSGRVRPAHRHRRPALILALPGSEMPSEEVFRPQYLVTLREGRNRQIRRTFAALGYKVVKLHRTQFGIYGLGDLKPGAYELFQK